MFVVIVNFKISENEDIIDKFIETAPMYQRTKGLIRKNYLVNEANNIAGGVYVFDNKQNAHEWFDKERLAYLTERYSKPEIKYFDSPVEVNNDSKEIMVN